MARWIAPTRTRTKRKILCRVHCCFRLTDSDPRYRRSYANWYKVVNSFVSSAQTLLNTSILDIKKFINIELAGPAGPTRPFRGESLPSSLHQSSISHLAACSATFLWVVYAGRAHGFGWPCWGRQVYPGELWKSGRWRLPVSGETHAHTYTYAHWHFYTYTYAHLHTFTYAHLHTFTSAHLHTFTYAH